MSDKKEGTLTLGVRVVEPAFYTDGIVRFTDRENVITSTSCKTAEAAKKIADDFAKWNPGLRTFARWSQDIDL